MLKENLQSDDIDSFRLAIYPADTKLQDYVNELDRKTLRTPDFQRDYVWDKRRASRFIESILLGLPVPNIFLYQEKGARENTIIDGQQRILTVKSFMKGEFVKGKNEGEEFRLLGVHEKWNKKKYLDLDEETRFKFDNYVIRATIIEQLEPDDGSSVFEIFDRLNTGGVKLNSMEVRMCVAYGEFTKLLKELNQNEGWGKLLGRKKLVKEDIEKNEESSREIEYILRFFLLQEENEKYSSTMIKALTEYIVANRYPKKDWLEEKRKIFTEVVDKALMLRERPFHVVKKGSKSGARFNLSVLDSIMVALSYSNISDKKSLVNSYNKLLNNGKYLELIHKGRNTTNASIIRERIWLAKQAFCND